ncbi:hypothetical protein HWI79_129 [Cryptosporidium felis]|nr:hypothetical protein HWI79_129 [Cryptosporidium felis]
MESKTEFAPAYAACPILPIMEVIDENPIKYTQFLPIVELCKLIIPLIFGKLTLNIISSLKFLKFESVVVPAACNIPKFLYLLEYLSIKFSVSCLSVISHFSIINLSLILSAISGHFFDFSIDFSGSLLSNIIFSIPVDSNIHSASANPIPPNPPVII